MDEDYGSFDFSGFDNLDISDLLSSGGGQDIDFGSLDAGPGGSDLSGIDLSALLGLNTPIDFSQIPGDFGGDLSSELLAALSNSGNASSLFSGDGGLDIKELLKPEGKDPFAGVLTKWEDSPLNSEANSRKLQNMISSGSDITWRNQDEGYRPNSGEAKSQGTQNASDLFDSFSLEEGQGTQDMSDLFDSFSLEGDQGFKFDDDTEPGSSGGTQGSEGAAGKGDLGSYEGSSYADLVKSLASTNKDTTGGTGLKATGRGQLSMVDKDTGATGITGEGFKSIEDLLGSGTKEEIARYTPGSADFSLRSGLETEGGQGLNADSTRGMSLANMGGGQGLSKYVPAEYEKGITTPYKGTGGTLSETGFLTQSSAANPLGSKYAIGDPKSFINNPTITGQQSVVSPGRTIIDNKDGTYKVVTNTEDGTKTITTNKDGVDKIIRDTKSVDTTKANPGAKANAADKKDNNMLMMLLALMAMMNKGGGGSTGSGGIIPALAANRTQLPYGPISGSQARPGAGGVNYFSPTSYTPRAAGGGMMYGGGGISDLGGYSDGGRLLRGPGDGVSDSIPATIGGKQPARLAEGEFVVPARVVSELGNGSTNAGAQKLYAMMNRVQGARRKTKNVAADTKAQKYLPA